MPMMQSLRCLACGKLTRWKQLCAEETFFNIQGSLSEGKRFPSHWLLFLNLPKAKYKSLCLPGKDTLKADTLKMYLLFLLLTSTFKCILESVY